MHTPFASPLGTEHEAIKNVKPYPPLYVQISNSRHDS